MDLPSPVKEPGGDHAIACFDHASAVDIAFFNHAFAVDFTCLNDSSICAYQLVSSGYINRAKP